MVDGLRPEGAFVPAGRAAGGVGLGAGKPMTALPGAPYLQRRADDLFLDGVELTALAQEFGTPLYVYSRGAMRAAATAYQQALAGRPHLLCYALKANSNLAVLKTFAEMGLGFDIVSGGELERVLAIGADPGRVVFSGVGKTDAEIGRALAVGVGGFNVESEGELERLSRLAASAGCRARVSLRVNPDVDPGTHPYIATGLKDTKFGVAHDRAREVYRRAASLPGIEVAGIDCHLGSQITAIAPYLDALDRLLDLVEQIEADGIRIDHLDLGGGLGITYTDESPPAADELVRALLARIDARGHRHRQVMLEPGRSLVGNAGVLLSTVVAVKPGTAKSFCIVDAAMNDLMRPALYKAWMNIVPCRQRAEAATLCDVVGPVCESGDWLGRDRTLAVHPGDVLAVLSAGAYGMVMAGNYNTRPRAAEVMVDDGRAALVRRRETVAELIAGEQIWN